MAKHGQVFIAKHGGWGVILASDEESDVCERYGRLARKKSMYGKKYMGIERSTFLIDGEGGAAPEGMAQGQGCRAMVEGGGSRPSRRSDPGPWRLTLAAARRHIPGMTEMMPLAAMAEAVLRTADAREKNRPVAALCQPVAKGAGQG